MLEKRLAIRQTRDRAHAERRPRDQRASGTEVILHTPRLPPYPLGVASSRAARSFSPLRLARGIAPLRLARGVSPLVLGRGVLPFLIALVLTSCIPPDVKPSP